MLPIDSTIRASTGIFPPQINPDIITPPSHRHPHIHHTSNIQQLNPPTHKHSNSSSTSPSTPTQDSDTISHHHNLMSALPNTRTPIPFLNTCHTHTPHISTLPLLTELSHTPNAIPCFPLPLPFPGNARGSHYTPPHNYNKHPTPSITTLPEPTTQIELQPTAGIHELIDPGYSHIYHDPNIHQLNPHSRVHTNSSFPPTSTHTKDSDTTSHLHHLNPNPPHIRTSTPFLDTCNTFPPHASPISLSTKISHTPNAIQCLPPPLTLPG